MEFHAPRPEYTPLTPVTSGLALHRGLSKFEQVQVRRGIWRVGPRAPLKRHAHDWLTLDGFFGSDLVKLRHVLEHLRQHAVSFSAMRFVAEYYATSLDHRRRFVQRGMVAETVLPDVRHAVGVANGPRAVYVFCDGTAWLDPRALVAQTAISDRYRLDCLTMQHRAQVDDELLLVHGTVQFRAVSEIRPEMVSVRHVPWKAVEDARGIVLSENLDVGVQRNRVLRLLGL